MPEKAISDKRENKTFTRIAQMNTDFLQKETKAPGGAATMAAVCERAKVHFSSASNEWTTPDDLFQRLDAQYHFTLDPCCTHATAKCAKHFTIEVDGLAQDWSQDRVFMNPPYGRAIAAWMKKAYEESLRGALVVCLVPARTDTNWWHEYAMRGGGGN